MNPHSAATGALLQPEANKVFNPASAEGASTTCLSGRLVLLLWGLYFVLSPFYLFPSGMPQISDFLILVLAGLLLVLGRIRIPRAGLPVVQAVGAFVLYVVVVNGTWTAVTGDPRLMLTASYYIFNFVACLVCVSQFAWLGARFVNWTGAAIIASLAIQTCGFAATSGSGGRAMFFFNNPNQLGYYVVLSGSLFWVWSRAVRMPSWAAAALPLMVYPMVVYLSLQSLSRAAIGSVVVMIGFVCLAQQKLAIVGALLLVALFGLRADWEILDRLNRRVESRTQSVSHEASNRGYDRMTIYSEHLFFGAGEGAYDRFRLSRHGEIHSSLGTVAFCYGVVGLFLLIMVLGLLAFGCGPWSLVFLIPPACYALTHNGMRQSELWILIMLIACTKWKRGRGYQVVVAPNRRERS